MQSSLSSYDERPKSESTFRDDYVSMSDYPDSYDEINSDSSDMCYTLFIMHILSLKRPLSKNCGSALTYR